MNEPPMLPSPSEIELERYEFYESPPYHFDVGRRDFFKTLGGGVMVISVLTEALAQQRRGGDRRGGAEPSGEIGAWIHIGEDGAVTAFTGKVELGQNIRTSLTQAVAEELRVPLRLVRLVMGDTDKVPFDMGTFGSRTTPTMSPQLRKAAAAARELLLDLAATKWNADRASLVAAEGQIKNASKNESCSYGDLTKGQKLTKTKIGRAHV